MDCGFWKLTRWKVQATALAMSVADFSKISVLCGRTFEESTGDFDVSDLKDQLYNKTAF